MNGCSHTFEDNPDGSRKCTACGEYEGNMFMLIPVPYHPGWTIQRAGKKVRGKWLWWIYKDGVKMGVTKGHVTVEDAQRRKAPEFIKAVK